MAESFRDKLGQDLELRYERLIKMIDDGLSTERTAWASCGACGKRTEVSIPDTRAAIAAAQFITEHSLGRPGVQTDAADSEKILFVRINSSDGARLFDAAKEFLPPTKWHAFLEKLSTEPAKA